MSVIRLPSKSVKGLSFSIAELILIRSWAEANALRMVVRLDHGSETEEYEEVLALHLGASDLCRWIMWRNAETVFLQPLIGPTHRYDSVAGAFEALAEKTRCPLTDIKSACRPA
ncbi:MAG TPA: hypothetical protein DDZ81_03490 [Acetobacteraceae bacterium]|jgi:hypothetical protein|nr:hypothetical protein [Acetobacteraceae bacterium]